MSIETDQKIKEAEIEFQDLMTQIMGVEDYGILFKNADPTAYNEDFKDYLEKCGLTTVAA